MGLSVVKRNKRLFILEDDRIVYSPPDFMRHRCNRELLHKLAWTIEHSGVSAIEAIVRFETRCLPNK